MSSLGFKVPGSIVEEQYKALRTADNMPPSEMPRLLLVMKNLGFVAPVVTVGNAAPDQYSLLLSDYLARGADPKVPVSVRVHWVEPDGSVQRAAQASTIYDRFADGLWSGFQMVCAVVYPGKATGELREQAFLQIPQLAQDFDSKLGEIASRGLDQLG